MQTSIMQKVSETSRCTHLYHKENANSTHKLMLCCKKTFNHRKLRPTDSCCVAKKTINHRKLRPTDSCSLLHKKNGLMFFVAKQTCKLRTLRFCFCTPSPIYDIKSLKTPISPTRPTHPKQLNQAFTIKAVCL